MRTVFSMVISGVILLSITGKSVGEMLSPVNDCHVSVASENSRSEGRISLRIACAKPQRQDVPVIVEYYLPQNIEIVAVGENPKVREDGVYTVLRWECLSSELLNYGVTFKILTPGFYTFHGNVSLGELSAKQLEEIGTTLADNIPAYSGADAKSRLFRKQFLNSAEEIKKSLARNLGLDPEKYYVQVTTRSIRIEDWDFGSLLKRVMHKFRGKTR